MTLGPDRRTIARRGHAATLPLTFAGMFPLVFNQNQDQGGNGEGNEGNEGHTNGGEQKPKVEFTPEQQAEVNRIAAREARKAAEKARADRDAEITAAQEKADADAKRKADEERGAFDEVKRSLESERDTVTAERDRLKAEHDALTSYFATQYEAALKELPDVIKAFAPDDDASFEVKSKWLTKATEQARTIDKQTPRGNGGDPKPGKGKIEIPSLINAQTGF